MKYTIFAFHVNQAELRSPDSLAEPTDLSHVLDQTEKHRATIYEGLYVFETKKGWQDMHLLRSLLVRLDKEYVELPFEGSIAGYFSSDTAKKLLGFGTSNGQEISLLNLNPQSNT